MRILSGSMLLPLFVIALSVPGLAACDQDPTEPSIFCVIPEEPIPGQITEFEITSMLEPTSAQWEFGDGHKETTLGSRFVKHRYAEPGRYTVKVWIAYEGGFDAITQIVIVDPIDPRFVPTPITSFDLNKNRRIDDEEFFAVVDAWIANEVKDITFFKVLDAWIGHTLVVDVRGTSLRQLRVAKSYQIYDLNGGLIDSWACSYRTSHAMQSKLLRQDVATGTYVLVERNCATNQMKSSFISAR